MSTGIIRCEVPRRSGQASGTPPVVVADEDGVVVVLFLGVVERPIGDEAPRLEAEPSGQVGAGIGFAGGHVVGSLGVGAFTVNQKPVP